MAKVVNENVEPIDGSTVVPLKEAGRILKEHDNRVINGGVESFVSLKDINKIYPNGVQAVYDFNIDIKEHDFIVLVGPSGCGKSTTLRMIAGLEDITSGYLYINKVLSNYLPSKNRDISMVFQAYALYPQMTVFDNIAFPLRVRKYHKAKESEVLKAWNQVLEVIERPNDIVDAIVDAGDRNLNYTNKPSYISTRLRICDKASKIILSYPIIDVESFDTVQVIKDKEGNETKIILKDKIIKDAHEAIAKEKEMLASKGYEVDEYYRLIKDGMIEYHDVRLTKEEIRNKVFEAAKILDLGPYLDRRPKELSGGQMQRVALGRAIVRNAKLFLMDEPLSNLDAKLRVQMRSEIVRIHEQIGATTIYVTHDQTEAMTMATKIAVMSKGWVQQIGAPQEIYSHPNNLFVATFIGSPAMNIFKAYYDNGLVVLPDGYKIQMSKEFIETHDRFYKEKYDDIKRMLDLADFKKMHALKIIDEVLFTEHYFGLEKYEKVLKDVLGLVKVYRNEYSERVTSLINSFLQDKKEAFKNELKYIYLDRNVKKIEEALEVIKTIEDEHGQKALELITEQYNFAKETLNAYEGERKEDILNEYKAMINEIIALTNEHVEKGANAILAKLNAINGEKILPLDARKWICIVRKELLTFEKMDSRDIGKLHNAQVFSETEVKTDDTLYYQKRKKKDDKKKAVRVNLNSVDIAFVNNLYDVAVRLLGEYEVALTAGKHDVKIGVRPEHIHLDEEYANPNKTNPFTISADVVELMGSELLVHTTWNDADFIAKISTGALVKPHTEIKVSMNGEKIHVFDIGSGDAIK